jgi:hypothetical protein
MKRYGRKPRKSARIHNPPPEREGDDNPPLFISPEVAAQILRRDKANQLYSEYGASLTTAMNRGLLTWQEFYRLDDWYYAQVCAYETGTLESFA